MSSKLDWKKISLSLDLVRQAKYYVEWLKHIDDQASSLYEPKGLKKAIFRYEKYWLPFCASLSDVDLKKCYPPIDVAWVYFYFSLNILIIYECLILII